MMDLTSCAYFDVQPQLLDPHRDIVVVTSRMENEVLEFDKVGALASGMEGRRTVGSRRSRLQHWSSPARDTLETWRAGS